MKLYEVNEKILELVEKFDEIDPETGLAKDYTEMENELQSLMMERDRILQYLAKYVLNIRSDVDALKNEEKRLADNRKRLERKEEALMNILNRECAGNNVDFGFAKFSYKKTKHVEISNTHSVSLWLEENGYNNCLKFSEPAIDKREVKKLLESGIEVEGCAVVEEYSGNLK